MDRSPAWSPDGKSIAYFSDESGEYALHIKPQNGAGETKKIPLAGKSAFYFDPKWSPDSKAIAFNDNMDNLWMVEISSGRATKVDTNYLYDLNREFNWSGDSKWIAFEKFLPNRLRAISIYSVESGKSVQITDGMSDARHPAFDRDGQYLYFTASTNYGPTTSGLDMSSDEHEVTSSIYLAVLPNNIPSPLAPESDEEGAPRPAAEGGRGGTRQRAPVRRRLRKLLPSRCGSISTRCSSASSPCRCPRAPISGLKPDVPACCSCWNRGPAAVADAGPAAAAPR